MSTNPDSGKVPADNIQTCQSRLLEIGEMLGYESRRSYTKSAAGDAVWMDRRAARYADEALPVVAFRILTFETAKEIREAIATLQAISPALGVLVVAESAYAERGAQMKKYTSETYPPHIRQIAEQLASGIGLSFRVEVWGEADIDRLYSVHVESRLKFGLHHLDERSNPTG